MVVKTVDLGFILLVGCVNGPYVPLKIVNVLSVGHSELVEGPDVIAEAAGGVLLELDPTNKLVNGLSVDRVFETELVGQESGIRDSVRWLQRVSRA